MHERIAVYVYGDDLISQAGVAAQLRGRPETYVVDDDPDRAAVAVVVVDRFDDDAARVVRGLRRDGCPKVVVVVTDLDDAALARAVESEVSGVLRRREVTPELLAHAVVTASRGGATLAPDLVGRLLSRVHHLQGATDGRPPQRDGMTDRERDVLRLLAEGHDTAEIARTLCYSERTIKNVIHDVTTRLNLRNRSHAVAYAVKAGIV